MSLTLKQILDIALGSTGVTVPTTWIGSNNLSTANQVKAIANQSVLTLRGYALQKQIREYSFTLSSTSSTYAMPADFMSIVPDTMWVQDSLWRVDFPTDPTVWAYLRASAGPPGIFVRCRIINDFFEFYQPQEGMVVGYEYYSNALIQDGTTGEPKEFFSQDSDVWLLDDAVIISDIKWRYKAEKGLEYQTDYKLYQDRLRDFLGTQGGSKTIMPSNPWNPEPIANLWQLPQ